MVPQQRWATQQELRLAILIWVEREYHWQQAQDALGDLTRIVFEDKLTEPLTHSRPTPQLSPVRSSRPDTQTRIAPRAGERYSSASIHGAYVTLSKVFAYALNHRLIAAASCSVVDKPKINRSEPTIPEPEEVAAELDAAQPYGLIVRFAARTGLRAGELAALRVRDVNLLRRDVEVRWTVHAPRVAGRSARRSQRARCATCPLPASSCRS